MGGQRGELRCGSRGPRGALQSCPRPQRLGLGQRLPSSSPECGRHDLCHAGRPAARLLALERGGQLWSDAAKAERASLVRARAQTTGPFRGQLPCGMGSRLASLVQRSRLSWLTLETARAVHLEAGHI